MSKKKEAVEIQTDLVCTPHLLRKGDEAKVQCNEIIQTVVSAPPNTPIEDLYEQLERVNKEDIYADSIRILKYKLYFDVPPDPGEEDAISYVSTEEDNYFPRRDHGEWDQVAPDAIPKEGHEHQETQTYLMVFPHYLRRGERAVVMCDVMTQTAVTCEPTCSVSEIVPKLHTYLDHTNRQDVILIAGDNVSNKSILDLINEILSEVDKQLMEPPSQASDITASMVNLRKLTDDVGVGYSITPMEREFACQTCEKDAVLNLRTQKLLNVKCVADCNHPNAKCKFEEGVFFPKVSFDQCVPCQEGGNKVGYVKLMQNICKDETIPPVTIVSTESNFGVPVVQQSEAETIIYCTNNDYVAQVMNNDTTLIQTLDGDDVIIDTETSYYLWSNDDEEKQTPKEKIAATGDNNCCTNDCRLVSSTDEKKCQYCFCKGLKIKLCIKNFGFTCAEDTNKIALDLKLLPGLKKLEINGTIKEEENVTEEETCFEDCCPAKSGKKATCPFIIKRMQAGSKTYFVEEGQRDCFCGMPGCSCSGDKNQETENENEANNEKANNNEANNEEANNNEANNVVTNNVEANNVEANNDKANNDEANNDEANNDEANNDEVNNDEKNNDKANSVEANNDEVSNDNANNIEANNDEGNNGETNNEAHNNEANNDAANDDAANNGRASKDQDKETQKAPASIEFCQKTSDKKNKSSDILNCRVMSICNLMGGAIMTLVSRNKEGFDVIININNPTLKGDGEGIKPTQEETVKCPCTASKPISPTPRKNIRKCTCTSIDCRCEISDSKSTLSENIGQCTCSSPDCRCNNSDRKSTHTEDIKKCTCSSIDCRCNKSGIKSEPLSPDSKSTKSEPISPDSKSEHSQLVASDSKSRQSEPGLPDGTSEQSVRKSEESVRKSKQSIGKSESMSESIKESMGESIKEPMSESIKESMSESIKEPMRESIKESMSDSIKEPMSKSVNESMSESINESMNKPINESMSESINGSMSESINESMGKSVNVSMSKSMEEALREQLISTDDTSVQSEPAHLEGTSEQSGKVSPDKKSVQSINKQSISPDGKSIQSEQGLPDRTSIQSSNVPPGSKSEPVPLEQPKRCSCTYKDCKCNNSVNKSLKESVTKSIKESKNITQTCGCASNNLPASEKMVPSETQILSMSKESTTKQSISPDGKSIQSEPGLPGRTSNEVVPGSKSEQSEPVPLEQPKRCSCTYKDCRCNNSVNKSLKESETKSINESMGKSINESMSKSVNESMSKSFQESITNQSISPDSKIEQDQNIINETCERSDKTCKCFSEINPFAETKTITESITKPIKESKCVAKTCGCQTPNQASSEKLVPTEDQNILNETYQLNDKTCKCEKLVPSEDQNISNQKLVPSEDQNISNDTVQVREKTCKCSGGDESVTYDTKIEDSLENVLKTCKLLKTSKKSVRICESGARILGIEVPENSADKDTCGDEKLEEPPLKFESSRSDNEYEKNCICVNLGVSVDQNILNQNLVPSENQNIYNQKLVPSKDQNIFNQSLVPNKDQNILNETYRLSNKICNCVNLVRSENQNILNQKLARSDDQNILNQKLARSEDQNILSQKMARSEDQNILNQTLVPSEDQNIFNQSLVPSKNQNISNEAYKIVTENSADREEICEEEKPVIPPLQLESPRSDNEYETSSEGLTPFLTPHCNLGTICDYCNPKTDEVLLTPKQDILAVGEPEKPSEETVEQRIPQSSTSEQPCISDFIKLTKGRFSRCSSCSQKYDQLSDDQKAYKSKCQASCGKKKYPTIPATPSNSLAVIPIEKIQQDDLERQLRGRLENIEPILATESCPRQCSQVMVEDVGGSPLPVKISFKHPPDPPLPVKVSTEYPPDLPLPVKVPTEFTPDLPLPVTVSTEYSSDLPSPVKKPTEQPPGPPLPVKLPTEHSFDVPLPEKVSTEHPLRLPLPIKVSKEHPPDSPLPVKVSAKHASVPPLPVKVSTTSRDPHLSVKEPTEYPLNPPLPVKVPIEHPPCPFLPLRVPALPADYTPCPYLPVKVPTEYPPYRSLRGKVSTEQPPDTTLPVKLSTKHSSIPPFPVKVPTEHPHDPPLPVKVSAKYSPDLLLPVKVSTEHPPDPSLPVKVPSENPAGPPFPVNVPSENPPDPPLPVKVSSENPPDPPLPVKVPQEHSADLPFPVQHPEHHVHIDEPDDIKIPSAHTMIRLPDNTVVKLHLTLDMLDGDSGPSKQESAPLSRPDKLFNIMNPRVSVPTSGDLKEINPVLYSGSSKTVDIYPTASRESFLQILPEGFKSPLPIGSLKEKPRYESSLNIYHDGDCICPPEHLCETSSKSSGKCKQESDKKDMVFMAYKTCEKELKSSFNALNNIKQELKKLNMPEVDCIFKQTDLYKPVSKNNSRSQERLRAKIKFSFINSKPSSATICKFSPQASRPRFEQVNSPPRPSTTPQNSTTKYKYPDFIDSRWSIHEERSKMSRKVHPKHVCCSPKVSSSKSSEGDRISCHRHARNNSSGSQSQPVYYTREIPTSTDSTSHHYTKINIKICESKVKNSTSASTYQSHSKHKNGAYDSAYCSYPTTSSVYPTYSLSKQSVPESYCSHSLEKAIQSDRYSENSLRARASTSRGDQSTSSAVSSHVSSEEFVCPAKHKCRKGGKRRKHNRCSCSSIMSECPFLEAMKSVLFSGQFRGPRPRKRERRHHH